VDTVINDNAQFKSQEKPNISIDRELTTRKCAQYTQDYTTYHLEYVKFKLFILNTERALMVFSKVPIDERLNQFPDLAKQVIVLNNLLSNQHSQIEKHLEPAKKIKTNFAILLKFLHTNVSQLEKALDEQDPPLKKADSFSSSSNSFSLSISNPCSSSSSSSS